MTDYILGVSDPKQWHSEVLICDGVLCICVMSCIVLLFDRPTDDFRFFHFILLAMASIKNLKLNKHHYASWMVHLGGESLVLAQFFFSFCFWSLMFSLRFIRWWLYLIPYLDSEMWLHFWSFARMKVYNFSCGNICLRVECSLRICFCREDIYTLCGVISLELSLNLR